MPQGSEARASSQLYVISALNVLYGRNIMTGMIQMIEYDNFILFWIGMVSCLVGLNIFSTNYLQIWTVFGQIYLHEVKYFSNLVYLIKYQ